MLKLGLELVLELPQLVKLKLELVQLLVKLLALIQQALMVKIQQVIAQLVILMLFLHFLEQLNFME
jgi:hypothetical protein